MYASATTLIWKSQDLWAAQIGKLSLISSPHCTAGSVPCPFNIGKLKQFLYVFDNMLTCFLIAVLISPAAHGFVTCPPGLNNELPSHSGCKNGVEDCIRRWRGGL